MQNYSSWIDIHKSPRDDSWPQAIALILQAEIWQHSRLLLLLKQLLKLNREDAFSSQTIRTY